MGRPSGPRPRAATAAGGRAPLGVAEGRGDLAFDGRVQAFYLDGRPVPLELVRGLDDRGLVRWRFMEHRDWMRRLDPAPARAAYERELERAGDALTGRDRLEEQIRRHVRKDDSYLHGRIVETDAGAPQPDPAPAAPRPDTAGEEPPEPADTPPKAARRGPRLPWARRRGPAGDGTSAEPAGRP
jgi:hypothetical protein